MHMHVPISNFLVKLLQCINWVMKLILFLRCLHIHHSTVKLQLCVHVAYPGWLNRSPNSLITQKRMANHLTTALLGRIQGIFCILCHWLLLLKAEQLLGERSQFSKLLHAFMFVLGTVSLFSCLAISDEEVSELKTLCTSWGFTDFEPQEQNAGKVQALVYIGHSILFLW